MNFEPQGDLATFLTFVDRLAATHGDHWTPVEDRFHYSEALDRQVEESGYFGALHEEGLGPVAAASMVYTLSGLAACAELMASALVAPLLPPLPRPVALLRSDAGHAVRFLPMARTVLRIDADAVAWASLREDDVLATDSVFAYPMGRLREPQALHWHGCADVDVHRLRDLWRIGIAAEIGGSLQAALHSVVEHVRQRQQFGRPLGSLQAVQHRLAAASSKLQGARLLMLAAAASGDPAQAAMAVGAAQSLSTPVVYDLHQFMGAMGLTLEHPLHRWTYRVRLLRSELGGADQHFERLADLAWSPAAG